MRKFLTLSLSFILIFFLYSNFSNFSDLKKKIQKKVHRIVIHGLDNLNENMILRKISLKEDQSFWDFNPKELKKDLQKIKGIKNFSFKMKSDGVLNIFITEEEPFMIWRFSNKIKYLNEKGEILDFDKKEFKNLIIFEGELEKKALTKFNEILNRHNELKKNIQKVYFSKNIGWKVFFKDKSCLYLPDKKIDKVISVYKKIKDSLFNKNFKYFDMRILERVYLNKENKCLTS